MLDTHAFFHLAKHVLPLRKMLPLHLHYKVCFDNPEKVFQKPTDCFLRLTHLPFLPACFFAQLLSKQQVSRRSHLSLPKGLQGPRILAKPFDPKQTIGDRLLNKTRLRLQRFANQILLIRLQCKVNKLSLVSHNARIIDIPPCRIIWEYHLRKHLKSAMQAFFHTHSPNIIIPIA